MSPTTWARIPGRSQQQRRLKIRKPSSGVKDIRQISAAIETSYENTKKHLDRLMKIGVVRKEAGLSRPTARGVRPVWKYSLVPGGLEAITRSLGLFANLKLTLTDEVLAERLASVRETVSGEFGGLSSPAVILLGGPEDASFPDCDRTPRRPTCRCRASNVLSEGHSGHSSAAARPDHPAS